jgi:hypothetical protein
MIDLYRRKSQIEALLASPATGRGVMLNLLPFEARATGPDADVSGEEAYQRYAGSMRPSVEERGGRMLRIGRVDSRVMGRDPEIGIHRSAGLESQWRLATTTRAE